MSCSRCTCTCPRDTRNTGRIIAANTTRAVARCISCAQQNTSRATVLTDMMTAVDMMTVTKIVITAMATIMIAATELPSVLKLVPAQGASWL